MRCHITPLRFRTFCLGLLACSAAWLVVHADDTIPPSGNSANPQTSSNNPLPRPLAAPPAPPALPATQEAIISEIMQIRREQGGLLDGTLLEELTGQASQVPGQSAQGQDAEFARALRGVAAAAATESTPSRETQAHPVTATTNSSLAGSDAQPNSPVDEQLISLLRLTARRLDTRAADCEDADNYRQADRCRATAKQLRQMARELKGAPTR